MRFAPKINLLYGPNGAGKTNVLEAVHYLCLTKSFLAARDRYALRQGSPYFEVEGTFGKQGDGTAMREREARLVYVPGEGKKIFLGGAPLDRLADVVGRLPVVVFSPEDIALTAEGPSERRNFVNNILSQEQPAYLDDLMTYRRARRQRNEVLKKYKKRGPSPPADLIAPWTEELVTLGSRIVHRRKQFLQTFAGFLEDAYTHVEGATERPTVAYDTFADDLSPDASPEDIAGAFRDALERTRQGEERRGRTLVGPQRDELIFRLGELEVRRYGSQGQHRTFGMALKLAQFFYLQDRLEETPLLLLDDAFGKLDAERTEAFLELLISEEVGQSLVTATDRASFEPVVPFETNAGGGAHRALRVEAGQQGALVRGAPSAAEPDGQG